MSNGAKVILERNLYNGLQQPVRQSVIQYADGSQVIVSSVLPQENIPGLIRRGVAPETLVFLAEGGEISDFSEIAGGRGANRHDSEVEYALGFETASAVGTEEPDENLLDFAFEGLEMIAGAAMYGDPGAMLQLPAAGEIVYDGEFTEVDDDGEASA